MNNYKVHHIALKASDIMKTIQFYRNVLGLCVKEEWGEGDNKIVLAAFPDGTAIEIFAGGDEPKIGCPKDRSGNFFHLAVQSEDTDKSVAVALSHGAVVKMPPTDMDIPSNPVMKVRIAFVFGPDGEELEFFQYRKK